MTFRELCSYVATCGKPDQVARFAVIMVFLGVCAAAFVAGIVAPFV